MAKAKKTVLVVDDVTTNLRYIGEILREDYTLFMAKSASQALKLMEKNKPDLILLDIKMPEMDGYQMLEILKADDNYKDIPVIFLSADNEVENAKKCIELGANDFIKKPFRPDDVLIRIGKIFSNNKG